MVFGYLRRGGTIEATRTIVNTHVLGKGNRSTADIPAVVHFDSWKVLLRGPACFDALSVDGYVIALQIVIAVVTGWRYTVLAFL